MADQKTEKQTKRLEHTEGGATTRDDPNDLGVPVLPGDPAESIGPEDALGVGPKRGDYRGRIPGDPHEGEVAQRPRADEIGEVKGKKGGVETGEDA